MSTAYLEHFFTPRSIVIIGASEEPPNFGWLVLRHLQQAGFTGELSVIHPKHAQQVLSIAAYTQVSELPTTPDLAVISTPPHAVPALMEALARKGVKAVLILTAGLTLLHKHNTLQTAWQVVTDWWQQQERLPISLEAVMLAIAKQQGMRVMGGGSMGIIAPHQGLNASYSPYPIQKGGIALLTHSVTLTLTLLDWASQRGIGFSHIVGLGDSVDVDVADVLDYLSHDRHNKAILLHLEKVKHAPSFLTALRAAARNKLVLVIKSGCFPLLQDPPEPLTAGLLNQDLIYDAVFRRVGALRVNTFEELFDALETLTRMKPLQGERLVILGNGAGANTLATDSLLRRNGQLATLSPATIARLQACLPPFWNARNPINLCADADANRYADALNIVLQDSGVDAALVIHIPTPRCAAETVADAVIQIAAHYPHNILTAWMGENSVAIARQHFNQAGIPTYTAPDKAIQAFLYMVNHARNQEMWEQTPPSQHELYQHAILPPAPVNPATTPLFDRATVQTCLQQAMQAERNYLSLKESQTLLTAYHITCAPTHYAQTLDELIKIAAHIGYPIAMKYLHQANCLPFGYGQAPGNYWRGIALDIADEAHLRRVVAKLQATHTQRHPDSPFLGFALQSMYRESRSLQLCVAVTRDATFGALILFGLGGVPLNMLKDRRVAIPPLNVTLARLLIEESEAYPVLKAYAPEPEVAVRALCRLLLQISQLIMDFPEIEALEIYPVLLSRDGVVALDVAIQLGTPTPLVIRPYPEELRESITLALRGWEVELRPIRGEDEPAHQAFIEQLSTTTLRYRFFHNKSTLSHRELAKLTQIDYVREMAFIACHTVEQQVETLGVVRVYIDADDVLAEFAVVIRDDLFGEGLGKRLMNKMINYCRKRGIIQMVGSVLRDNHAMLKLAHKLGFQSWYNAEQEVMQIALMLNPITATWQTARVWKAGD